MFLQKELIDLKLPETLKTQHAFAPFSQAIKAGSLLFIAGQTPADLKTGKIVKGTIKEEAKQVFENIKYICESAGTSLDNVVKVNVYLKNFKDRDDVNAVRAQYFKKIPPVSTMVEVTNLWEGIRIEIEAIVVIP